MSIRRGDVVRVLFPNSDLVTSKRRPALVIQRDNLNSGIAQVLVAMITSNLSRNHHPSRVAIMMDSEIGRESGLRLDSVIMTDNIVTVRSNEIDSVIGAISLSEAIDTALKFSFRLEIVEDADEYHN